MSQTGDSDVRGSAPSLGKQPAPSLPPGLPGAQCQCGCRRLASRRSGYRWWHGHDPAVSLEERRAALQLGGRRGQMAPAEVVALLADTSLTTREGRHELRSRLLAARAADRVPGAKLRDLLAVIDSAVKDDAPRRDQAPEPAPPIVVEVTRFSPGEGAPA